MGVEVFVLMVGYGGRGAERGEIYDNMRGICVGGCEVDIINLLHSKEQDLDLDMFK